MCSSDLRAAGPDRGVAPPETQDAKPPANPPTFDRQVKAARHFGRQSDVAHTVDLCTSGSGPPITGWNGSAIRERSISAPDLVPGVRQDPLVRPSCGEARSPAVLQRLPVHSDLSCRFRYHLCRQSIGQTRALLLPTKRWKQRSRTAKPIRIPFRHDVEIYLATRRVGKNHNIAVPIESR